MILKFHGWPWKTIGHLFYAALIFVHHFIAINELKLELQFGNAKFGAKSMIFVPCVLEIWQMTLKKNRAPFVCYFMLIINCASFRGHGWIQTGVTVRKHLIWVKINIFWACDFEICRMTLENNREPLLSNIKLWALFHHHMWIQTGVMVQKLLNWVLTLTFDLWPWPFAMDITSVIGNNSWKFHDDTTIGT